MTALHHILIKLLQHDDWNIPYECSRSDNLSLIAKRSESLEIMLLDTELIKNEILVMFPKDLSNIILSYMCCIHIPNMNNVITLNAYYLVFVSNQLVYRDKLRLILSTTNYVYYIDHLMDVFSYETDSLISYKYNVSDYNTKVPHFVDCGNKLTSQQVLCKNKSVLLYDELTKEYVLHDMLYDSMHKYKNTNLRDLTINMKILTTSIECNIKNFDFDKNVYIRKYIDYVLIFRKEDIITKATHNYIIDQLVLLTDYMQNINKVMLQGMYEGKKLVKLNESSNVHKRKKLA